MVLEKSSEDQSYYSYSSGDHEWVYQIWCQSMKQILRYFSLEQTDRLAPDAIHRVMPLAWLESLQL